jgi:serine/alanine adding enzyme
LSDSFFHNQVLINILKQSSYFSPLEVNFSNKISFLGLRTGNLFSKRIICYGLPTNDPEELNKLLISVDKHLKNDIYCEFRNLIDQSGLIDILSRNKYKWLDWYNISINTFNINIVWDSINSGKKRQIKKSIENGGEICLANGLEDVQQFYQILSNLYKNKIHKPLPDWPFFKTFYEETKDSDFGKYVLVKYQGKIVAGMMCPITPDKEMYEWYVAGLDQEYKGTGIYPSVLVTWGALKYACEHNIKRFNFMGAGQPDKHYGVRDFKMQFGGELVNSGRYIKVNKPILYWLGKKYFQFRELF